MIIVPVILLGVSSFFFLQPDELAPLITKIGGKTLQARMKSIWEAYGPYLKPSADRLQIPVSTCAAIIANESSGTGFGKDGRLLIRFEPKVFKKRTGQSVEYSHKNQAAEYESFERAKQVNEMEAYNSISMGMSQVMGFNCKMLGYSNPKDMFIAFQSGVGPQIDGFFKFVENKKNMVKYAQNDDFASFACGYNGSGYRANKYDEKMAAAKKAFVEATGIV